MRLPPAMWPSGLFGTPRLQHRARRRAQPCAPRPPRAAGSEPTCLEPA